jgi:Protein kinase domain
MVRDEDVATLTIKPQAKPSSSSTSSEEGRFPAGTVLTGRYRVLGLIGQGGMGEVYRAIDLKLNQPVALKFLPESTAGNPQLLERFHGEVRIARQVSHPNVCRVYDMVKSTVPLTFPWSTSMARIWAASCAASGACPATKPSRSRASSAPASPRRTPR